MSVYNSLVPYIIDSDKDSSDADNSSLSGEDNTNNSTTVILGKIKYSPDQKVPDKKPLVMRPKEDPCDEVVKNSPPKKCLVLKPQLDDSPICEREKDILPTKKCLVLKPKDDEEPLEIKTEPESMKKCLVRIPKDDCETSTSKASHSSKGKELERKNRRRENGISESETPIKSKIRLDHNNFNGLVLFLSYFSN